MARAFSITSPGSYRLSGSAIAIPGHRLDTLLSQLAPAPQRDRRHRGCRGVHRSARCPGRQARNTLEVTASSTLGSLPSLAPSNLFEAGEGGARVLGGGDPPPLPRAGGGDAQPLPSGGARPPAAP